MRYIISGKNIEVTPALKTAVQDKIGKLERYFEPDTEIQVTLAVEKDRQRIEVTIPVKGTIIRAEQESSDMYVSIDLVEEVIERQLKKYKNKLHYILSFLKSSKRLCADLVDASISTTFVFSSDRSF